MGIGSCGGFLVEEHVVCSCFAGKAVLLGFQFLFGGVVLGFELRVSHLLGRCSTT
jgi:hypothetical protein